MVFKLFMLMLACCLLSIGCGLTSDGSSFDASVSTQSTPILSRIEPTTAAAGDTITLFGHGFSSVPAFNIVVIGTAESGADTYTILSSPTADELESLTVTIPEATPSGSNSIYIVVLDHVTNTDKTITITP